MCKPRKQTRLRAETIEATLRERGEEGKGNLEAEGRDYKGNEAEEKMIRKTSSIIRLVDLFSDYQRMACYVLNTCASCAVMITCFLPVHQLVQLAPPNWFPTLINQKGRKPVEDPSTGFLQEM